MAQTAPLRDKRNFLLKIEKKYGNEREGDTKITSLSPSDDGTFGNVYQEGKNSKTRSEE